MTTGLDELCPPVCVECDYSLVGLPRGSRCPECGAPMDESVITLRGFSAVSLAAMRPHRAAMSVAAVGAWVAFWYFSRYQLSTLWVVPYVTWCAIPLVRRFALLDDVAPARLRLSHRGFEQRIGPGRLRLTPWHRSLRMDMFIRRNGRHSITLRWAIHSFRLAVRSEVVQFEFDAAPEQARRLQAQIRLWLESAQPRRGA